MQKLNVIFVGSFPYPHGMAGTKRIQHAIDGLKVYDTLSVRVVVLRQSRRQNTLAGVHEGVPYETVMGDLVRLRMAMMAPVFHMKAKHTVERMRRHDMRNILYVYGPPSIDNVPTIRHARCLGFKVVFDIVEDDNLEGDVSRNPWHRIKNMYVRHATRQIASLADGLIVISSHLEKKFRKLVSEAVPLFYRPISVDMKQYHTTTRRLGNPATLFYGGGFGPQNGVDNLVKAFDRLVGRGVNLRLVLTGPDNEKRVPRLLSLCSNRATSQHIRYYGYLDDDEYYRVLSEADIPCVPRSELGYAHAGFPFKLGEYLATGKPVVVSSVSDVCRFVRDRESAVVVRPGSVEALVDGILYLLSHPCEASAIGSRGQDVAREFFDYRSQASHLYTFLRDSVLGTDNRLHM